ncbi:ATP-binding protein [Methylocapsa palsarum]|uniref:histidine kinase n=1 Tax=Methylocapsa palsarum TaxID=1612308 RepID=A0A1I4ARP2_9HYPH|nr:ATP-binding protein [Methylocapsa palsarum]SFK59155.1 PAS domain S-box-containing protein [Methylocapsa palsarum]
MVQASDLDAALMAAKAQPSERGSWLAFTDGGGEMGVRIRAFDWSATPLGPLELWPQSLRMAVRIMLTSRFAMWMAWGPNLTFFCNDSYLPTTGDKREWVLGLPADQVWAEIWPEIGPRIERVFATGEATWDEQLLLYLKRSGFVEETYHTFSYSPLADDSGVTAGILCVVAEVTQRLIGERQLATLRDLACRLAAASTRIDAMAEFERCFSANPHDLPFALIYLTEGQGGRATLRAAHGVDRESPSAASEIEVRNGKPAWRLGATIYGEGEARLPAGSLAGLRCDHWRLPPEHALIAPIGCGGGATPLGFLVAGLNPHRTLDLQYRGFIELLVGQLAAAIARADEYESEHARAEALAEIDRAKTIFFSNASHEFRTPLTLILGPVKDMLARDPASAEIMVKRAELELINRNGVRLLKLVNTLLDFSRIEAGRVQAAFEPIDLASFTTELASTFRSAMEKAGLRFTVDCPPLPNPVNVDRDMWERIVLNLISNAFKYTFEGEVEISLRLDEDQNVSLTVRDSGVGIPSQELPRLFERFHRIEGQRGRTQEGTGIGLAMVQELARLHGGSLHAESVVGRGSAFTVTIPVRSEDSSLIHMSGPGPEATMQLTAESFVDEALRWLPKSEEVAKPVSDLPTARLAAVESPTTRPPRVLLADDNADMRDYISRLLKEHCVVEVVGDGQAALDAIRRSRPDLVLSDIMMPGLDGFGLLRALREDSALRDTPVILLSARAGEEASVEGLDAGADDYLIKPFSARELIARVRANLNLASLRREAVRVETELRRQAQFERERVEAILASISDGFLTVDRDWRFTYVNAAAERILGQPYKDLIGTNFWEEYPASRGAAPEADFRRAMSERISVSFEIYYTPWRKWFDVRANPSQDGGLAVFVQDVTQRRQVEDALRSLNETLELQVAQRTSELQAKESRLRTIFETSFIYQGLLDLDGKLIDANATSLQGIAATLKDVAGKAFWKTPWFTGTPGVSEKVRRAIPIAAGGENVREEIHVNLPVGGWRSFDFQMRPVRDEQGGVVAIVPEAVEITERRKIEEALRQSQKMEALGQLTGGIAHDFNNLLTGIMGSLEMIGRKLEGRESEGVDRYIAAATACSQRAAALTHRLLAFARRQSLDTKAQDVNSLVRGLEDLLKGTLGENIVLEIDLMDGLWLALTDAHQLESAILNLVINARDAMPDGGRLMLRTANRQVGSTSAPIQGDLEPGEFVLVEVTDTGAGMSKEVIAKAFDPFFTTKPIGQGTGLGLSMIYGFIKQSDGHVFLNSEPGVGTTVSLYMKRAKHDLELSPPIDTPAENGDGETVLVVEDDATIRLLVENILEELGYHAISAGDAAAALPHLESAQKIDLLVTDVGLPNMNGRQLAEIARQIRPKLKVLFMTGYAAQAAVRSEFLPPNTEILPKPFTLESLGAKISQIIAS